MTILDLKKTEQHITNWIKNYAESNGIQALIVGLSGGVDSALVSLLCQKTGIKTLCINLPCHSSNSAWERSNNFATEFGLNLTKIDLSGAHELIVGQITGLNTNNYALGGLRSCLRAPVLSYFALANKGIIVGTGNRSEDHLIRYFQKFGDGCVDISPIADLFKSEVYELFKYMTEMTNEGPKAALAIYNATPTADLWGPDGGHEDELELGITYDELEWADRENMKTHAHDNGTCGKGIITSDVDPTKHQSWLSYSARQRVIIAKVHAMEKASRHKVNYNLPICRIRQHLMGLVR